MEFTSYRSIFMIILLQKFSVAFGCTGVDCLTSVRNVLVNSAVDTLKQMQDTVDEEDIKSQAEMLVQVLVILASIVFLILFLGVVILVLRQCKKCFKSKDFTINTVAVRTGTNSHQPMLASRKSSAFFSFPSSGSEKSSSTKASKKSKSEKYNPTNPKTISVQLRENRQLREIEPIPIVPGQRINSELPFPVPYPVKHTLEINQFHPMNVPSKKITRQFSSVKYSLDNSSGESYTTLDIDSVLSKSSYTSRCQSTSSFDMALKYLGDGNQSEFLTDIMINVDKNLNKKGLTPKNSFISILNKPSQKYLEQRTSQDSAVVESIPEYFSLGNDNMASC